MEDNDKNIRPNKINYVGFSYDCSYFCLGTDIGFQVYQTEPLSLLISKKLNGGIGVVKILDKSNVFCLVGGGKNPRFSPNVLMIWDDKKDEVTNEYRCDSFIINCYIKQNFIFIICSDNIILLKTKNFELIEKINTINNPKGIFSVCNEPKKNLLAFPDNKGNIIIKFLDNIFKENKEKIKEKENKKDNNKIISSSNESQKVANEVKENFKDNNTTTEKIKNDSTEKITKEEDINKIEDKKEEKKDEEKGENDEEENKKEEEAKKGE